MKKVLVTGAYGGIGRAVVSTLKKEGYFVYALDKKVGEKEDGVCPVQADITDLESVRKAYEQVKNSTDELYSILHFAGIYNLDSLIEMSEQDFLRVYDVNLFGAYRINKTFMPLLSKGGKILITTSELAPLDPLPFTGIYALSKSALDDYAYSLRMELQLLGVSVAVLRPGAVDTGMISVSTSKLDEFIAKTSMYSFSANRFKKIVDRVEARKIPPQKIAEKTNKIISKSRPKQVYKINRNPLLLILNLFPRSVQTFIIKKILKN
ncbi:MAG: SDR family NAD(P)-dependent oxidoreductase [Clostridia bacterium]|nr:SDR family NAD(P)-dependent oxidoreductase [Clostridia bacterium]